MTGEGGEGQTSCTIIIGIKRVRARCKLESCAAAAGASTPRNCGIHMAGMAMGTNKDLWLPNVRVRVLEYSGKARVRREEAQVGAATSPKRVSYLQSESPKRHGMGAGFPPHRSKSHV